FPPEILSAAFQEGLEAARHYHPDPFGQRIAREAIANFYRERDFQLGAEQILLTSGSSLSFLYLFHLFGNTRAEFLCPQPSYPLFDVIAQHSGVCLTHYPLREKSTPPHWSLDLEELENRVTTKTRAIVVISPHNPTGWVADTKEWEGLRAIAERHALPI